MNLNEAIVNTSRLTRLIKKVVLPVARLGRTMLTWSWETADDEDTHKLQRRSTYHFGMIRRMRDIVSVPSYIWRAYFAVPPSSPSMLKSGFRTSFETINDTLPKLPKAAFNLFLFRPCRISSDGTSNHETFSLCPSNAIKSPAMLFNLPIFPNHRPQVHLRKK